MTKTVRLEHFIEKAHIKFRDFDGAQEPEVFGVSNTEGITRTAHRKSDDLSDYLVIEPGSLAYNPYRVNVGSIGLTPEGISGLVSPAYVVFRAKERKLVPEVLLDFLKSSEGLRQINKLARGTVRKALRFDDLCEIEFPAIPYDRQLEILEHKQGFNRQHGILLSEIAHQESLLAKLKQAILQEAIQGRLTADWRAANPDVESVSQLFHRIQAEKARLIAEKKLRKEKPLPEITPEEVLFEIPKGWEWCRLGEIAIHSLGKMLDKGKNKGVMKPYLRNLNVQWFNVNVDDLKEMPFEEDELEKYTVERGDVVICEGGYPGQAAIWDGDDPIMFQKALHRVRFVLRAFDSRLFVYYLKLADAVGFLRKHFTGAAIRHFTGQSLHQFTIPLPPLAEQAAIVERVEALMRTCQALEVEIDRSRTYAAQLLQAVLKEAFAPAS